MQNILQNKGLILLILFLVLGVFAYRSLSSSLTLLESDSTLEVGKDLAQLSARLEKVSLSQEVLGMAGYTHLIDFATPLPQQSFGRKNPFDIIGRE